MTCRMRVARTRWISRTLEKMKHICQTKSDFHSRKYAVGCPEVPLLRNNTKDKITWNQSTEKKVGHGLSNRDAVNGPESSHESTAFVS